MTPSSTNEPSQDARGTARELNPAKSDLGELVARLRAYRPLDLEWGNRVHHTICDEAADALSKAEAEVASLKARVAEVLEPFAKKSATLHSGYDDGIAAGDYPSARVLVADLRRAAELHAAVTTKEP